MNWNSLLVRIVFIFHSNVEPVWFFFFLNIQNSANIPESPHTEDEKVDRTLNSLRMVSDSDFVADVAKFRNSLENGLLEARCKIYNKRW